MNDSDTVKIFQVTDAKLGQWAYKYHVRNLTSNKYSQLNEQCIRTKTTNTQLVMKISEYGQLAVVVDEEHRKINMKYVGDSNLGLEAATSVSESLRKAFPLYSINLIAD